MRFTHTTRLTAILAAGVLLLGACSSTPGALAELTSGNRAVTATVSIAHTVTATPAPVATTQTVTAPAETVTVFVTEAADTPEPETSEEPTTDLTIGGPGVTATNDDGSATITVLSVKRVTEGYGDYGKPPKNGNYLLIDVSYDCTSGTFDYNPYDWTVRDGEVRSYDEGSGFTSGYDGPELHSGTLAKGSKARGTMVVDAPKGALTLEYAPFFGAPAIWNVPG